MLPSCCWSLTASTRSLMCTSAGGPCCARATRTAHTWVRGSCSEAVLWNSPHSVNRTHTERREHTEENTQKRTHRREHTEENTQKRTHTAHTFLRRWQTWGVCSRWRGGSSSSGSRCVCMCVCQQQQQPCPAGCPAGCPVAAGSPSRCGQPYAEDQAPLTLNPKIHHHHHHHYHTRRPPPSCRSCCDRR
jgi:hypothetical protein